MKYIYKVLLGIFLISGTVRAQDFELLENVVREGKVDVLEEAVKRNASLLEYQNYHGYSLLMIAVYNNQLPTAEYLLSHEVTVDLGDKSGNTALMGAAFQGYTKLVHLLIDNKANVNKQNYNGATALHFAATFNHITVVEALLNANINKEIKNNFGDTAYDTAIKQGNEKLAKMLKKQ